ncbi:hypothetical protein G6541_22050, partial [Streptomyces albidoflavus]|nr:hypothetical protein [Streptomyces albidoflavus]
MSERGGGGDGRRGVRLAELMPWSVAPWRPGRDWPLAAGARDACGSGW